MFAVFLIASVIVFWKTLSALVAYSLSQESCSHILLIPLVSLYLLYLERDGMFLQVRFSPGPGAVLMVAGIGLYFLVSRYWHASEENDFLCGATLALVLIWAGGFLVIYGNLATRAAAFPLLFLLLMVPLPNAILTRTIHLLQKGSTDVAYLLFDVSGVPVLRRGFLLSVPGITIEVAKECSGIRSSLALFISCLLAAHLFLRTRWKMFVFVALAVPLAIIKNGIRITTLTLLSLYVDPGFLTGRLHHEGGFVFFLLALISLGPVLLLLQRSEDLVGSQKARIQARKKIVSRRVHETPLDG